jgi:hypothetical protein
MEVTVPINHLAVLVGALSTLVVGTIWYGPLFGKQWIALMGWTPEQMAAAKQKGMGKTYLLQFLGSLLMVYTFAHVHVFAAAYTKTSGAMSGLTCAFWLWLGFIVPVALGSVLWDGKPWKLFWLNVGHYLASLAVIGVILSLWK